MLVYVGAVMVLFLFVVMMLDVHTDKVREGFWKHLPLAGLVGALIALEMAAILMGGFTVSTPKELPPEMLAMGNSKAWAWPSTPTTCTRCRSPRCCCWWPSLPPSR